MKTLCKIRGHEAGWIALVAHWEGSTDELDAFEWGCKRCGVILPRETLAAVCEPRDAENAELRRDLYDATAAGVAEVVGERNGEPLFALTSEGVERVRAILDTCLDQYGDDAPIVLAETIEIPIPLAAEVLAFRMQERRAV